MVPASTKLLFNDGSRLWEVVWRNKVFSTSMIFFQECNRDMICMQLDCSFQFALHLTAAFPD